MVHLSAFMKRVSKYVEFLPCYIRNIKETFLSILAFLVRVSAAFASSPYPPWIGSALAPPIQGVRACCAPHEEAAIMISSS
jgi:hypothetical protein